MLPYLSHTEEDIGELLREIGVKNIDDLFSDITGSVRHGRRAGDDLSASCRAPP